MDMGAIIGLLISVTGIMLGYLIEAKFEFSKVLGLIQPTAGMIVFGGTIGALMLATPMADLKIFLSMLHHVYTLKNLDELNVIDSIINIADKSRREGLLSLEKEISEIDNELLKRGLALVIDGVDPNTIKDILSKEVELHEYQFETAIKSLEKMGGFAPTMGVTGTVMGMVVILSELGGDTGALGHSIAVAFVATLYGVASANVLYLPAGERLKGKMTREAMVDELVIEGILSIQAGENPRVIKEKLNYAMFEKMAGKKPSEEAKDSE